MNNTLNGGLNEQENNFYNIGMLDVHDVFIF
jgi:hypothetical protein